MSSKRRMFAIVGALGSITLAGVLGTASTASAASIPAVEAQATYIYLYEHDDYAGGSFRTSGHVYNLQGRCWSGSGCRDVNDNASSMKNRKPNDASFYAHANGEGPSYYAQANSVDSDLTNNGFDNRISSIRIW
ncbi:MULTISPECIES: peptidase inhibitor family I36 protein [Nocardiopsis]|uniref:Beta/gamma crystallin 'Greek key' domain-containing protein n=2 Tax=Nocardiopsis TaxID=2013 RepID=D7B2P5_NOCDD|nr:MULTISPECIES: peptidase inhibitor family I36 protein [Nocardiopsis]ADH66743.1 hypothetical protein Ndas_1306 [Nocardiopsis dassonvillei subsp. dassonvillei DSM 43111]NKY78620.1 hypothetical protein [Nocardiopsis dassonvillei]NKZ00869.1 hypothetical protein [Nocardiopsis alborubida]VEI92766.1 Uncharacterised protein [Nocardiopsis dassonvillei]